MLQSNGLIDNADAAELAARVFDLSYRVSMVHDTIRALGVEILLTSCE